MPRSIEPAYLLDSQALNSLGRSVETHRALLNQETGFRRFTVDDIPNWEATWAVLSQLEGMTSEAKAKEQFVKIWTDGCGVGAIMPELSQANLPSEMTAKGKVVVGETIVAAWRCVEALRDQLSSLFPNGKILDQYASRTYVDVGSGAGSDAAMLEHELLMLAAKQTGNVYGANSKWLMGMLGNLMASQLAVELNTLGGAISSNAACASAGASWVNALDKIALGRADIALAGGTELATRAASTYLSFDYILRRRGGALARNWKDEHHPLTIFGAERGGFVPGDAAAMAVLASEKVLNTIQASPLARVVGYQMNNCNPTNYAGKAMSDGTIKGQGDLLIHLMQQLREEGIDPQDRRVWHLMHGTGTHNGAINELGAVTRMLEQFPGLQYAVTGNKESLGHTLGAALAVSMDTAAMAIKTGKMPVLATTTPEQMNPDKLWDDCISAAEKEKIELDKASFDQAIASIMTADQKPQTVQKGDIIIASAHGFGGINTAVAIEVMSEPTINLEVA